VWKRTKDLGEMMEKKDYYVVKYEGNYGDEFDISGFFVVLFSNKELKDANDRIKTAEGEELYFGTNEFVEFNPKAVVFKKITNSEYKSLVKIFGKYGDDIKGVSIGVIPGDLEDIINGTREDEEI